MMNFRKLSLSLALAISAAAAGAQVLDKRALLERQDFWINRDFDWFEANIPFFDSPDEEINTTYYYRWELVTRHFVYGSPNHGYAFTEFANRPFWSGAYGTISCPAGHHLYEVRWLHEPRYVRDYLRFWARHPGAQPRNYSFWLADSARAVHQVHPDPDFTLDLLPDLIRNYEAWKARCWVEEMGLFWQLGHDDGMEFDINARQTRDILRGGPSLRPSFNAYMWADATAIAEMARLKGETAVADEFSAAADRIKAQVETLLWDPSRQFFFPMSHQEHEKDGHVVQKHTLTYQSGQFAGSPHGRELHGYVPWAFNMPGPGFENAWRFLMDEDFFKAPFGPTTLERHDPQFILQNSCCWWSGHSWPFASTQTLKAMANLLQHYRQSHVDRRDYAALLHTFAITHRKDGKPYIAEAAHPFTGSWDGHDMPNRSEHYFHSGFTDLVITGLVGVQPAPGDSLTIHPLAPDDWDFFAIDHLPYRGHILSVLWDRSGGRYHKGKGLQVFVNGEKLAESATLGRLTVKLPAANIQAYDENPPMNFAVNNEGDFYPRYEASFVHPHTSLAMLRDGQYRYDIRPTNRWTTEGSPNEQDWVEVDFGTRRVIDTVKLYLLDDGEGSAVRAPAAIQVSHLEGGEWKEIPGLQASTAQPHGRRPYVLSFPSLPVERLRVVLHHAAGARSGLTELEAWGPGVRPYVPAAPPAGNLAYQRNGEGYPKASASHSDVYGGLPARAIDGKILYEPVPNNRWTCYGSPNARDWFALEFAGEVEFNRAVLHLFDDRGGVRAPASYSLESWSDGTWREIPGQAKHPETPTGGMANTVTFPPLKAAKIRVLFTHQGEARSGLTEFELWKDSLPTRSKKQ